MAAETRTNPVINAAPSKRVLFLSIIGENFEVFKFPKPNMLETFREISQIAAEMAFGEEALARTDGDNYFTILVPSNEGKDAKLVFGDMSRAQGDTYELWIDAYQRDSFQAEMNAFKGFAEILHDIMSEMTVVWERPIAHIDEHMTVQQLFLASSAAEVIAVAWAQDGVYHCSVDYYWSYYQAICRAKTSVPAAYMSMLGARTGMVRLSELQNPYYLPMDLDSPEDVSITELAGMPISNHSLGLMDDDIVAGCILSHFTDYFRDEDNEIPYCKAPAIVHMNAETLIEDGFGRQRLKAQTGSAERVKRYLADEKEEFLE